MRPENRFALLCLAVACVALGAVWLPAPALVRSLAALPLVFVLPGIALLRALNLRFAPAAHAPIAIGLSMAITVLGGLMLDPVAGLTPRGWVIWLAGVSLLLAIAAGRHGEMARFRLVHALKFRHGAALTATAVMLVLTVSSSLRATAAYRPFPHTSFWMLPLATGGNMAMIGIRNEEGRPETYAVRLMVGRQVAGEWGHLVLAPGQTVTYPVLLHAGAAAEAWLYRTEQPGAIYRRVTIAGGNDANRIAATSAVTDAQSGGQ